MGTLNKRQINSKLAEISQVNPTEDFQWSDLKIAGDGAIVYAWAKTHWTVEMIHERFWSVGLEVTRVECEGDDAKITFREALESVEGVDGEEVIGSGL